MMEKSGLPAFDSPPVVETVAAIEFAPLASLTFVEIARLVDAWSDEYPVHEVKEAIPSHSPQPASGPQLQLVTGPQPVRLWLLNESGWLVQVQHDRLVVNWRDVPGGITYPRYPAIRSRFFQLWDSLSEFLADRGLEAPVPTSADFTYVNRVDLEPGEGPEDALTLLARPAMPLPGSSGAARFQFARDLAAEDEEFAGQVIVTGEPDATAGSSSYAVTVTTRLALPVGAGGLDLRKALDVARSVGVRTFASVTTEAKQDLWGRTQ